MTKRDGDTSDSAAGIRPPTEHQGRPSGRARDTRNDGKISIEPPALIPLDSARREAAVAALARLIGKLLTSGRGAPGEATGDIGDTDAEHPAGP